jgi:hypothetical protein
VAAERVVGEVIHVLSADPTLVEADALLRSVGTDLEPCTTPDRLTGDRAGIEVLARLRGFGEVPIGCALVTPGGSLSTPLLIHAVIRSREEPITEATVARALRNGLRQASEWRVRRLALLPLGTGAGNLDAEVSAGVMRRVLLEHYGSGAHPREFWILVQSDYEGEVFAARMQGPWVVGRRDASSARGVVRRSSPDDTDPREAG